MHGSLLALLPLFAAPQAVPSQDPAPYAAPAAEVDYRAGYDVESYTLDLEVDPVEQRLEGAVTLEGRVLLGELAHLQLDLVSTLDVEAVLQGARELDFARVDDRLYAELSEPLTEGETFTVTVRYGGKPRAEDSFSGFHWAETADGRPWINTSCQGPGAHSWWPCKSSYYHPEDKPARVRMNVTVPGDLYAVSNGALVGIDEHRDGRKTYRWAHDYPLETYSVTLNVAPYVVVAGELVLTGIEEPVPWIYYVLPENAEKAALQFQDVPELLRIYSEAFGPWPFPDSKFALVETNFWGMEHSTAIAYGSSYPAWCVANGERDRFASRNRWFDYILVHEVAHEWWGNAVSATHWGDFWIHEGFGTYAEGVYVEGILGTEKADEYFRELGRRVGKRSKLYRGEDVDSGEAYASVVYYKGAYVLHALRQYVGDDEVWWKALREFNLKFRYGNAGTRDFQAVLEGLTGGDWSPFFDSWVYGEGYPELEGTVEVTSRGLLVNLRCTGSGDTEFTVPVDIAWTENGEPKGGRLWVGLAGVSQEIECAARPEGVTLPGIERLIKSPRVELP